MTAGRSVSQTCASCGVALRPGATFCPSCGTGVPDAEADAPPADPLIGNVLAQKFRIHSVLGEGGMGRVYKAEQLPLGIDVVIKVLHPQLCADPVIVRRFFREAQAASRLRHPNSVGVLDFGDSDGTLYIAMEFLRGRTLAHVLEQDGVFDPKRAVRVINQVLDVLEAAHRMSIIHRDLKPDNIMVEDLPTQRDFVKVLDFGIAKIVERDGGGTKLTQTGMIFGTPQYMAPEQATEGQIDGRTDLYSVGVVLFELLTGTVPFRSTSLAGLLADLVSKPPPPILTIRPDVPPKLAALVDSALSKDPAQRPQQALELKLALEAVVRPATRDRPGEPGKLPCPACGQPVPANAKFCGECGASTVLATATQVGNDKFADLRRFLPPGVVDDLAQMRVRGAGEKREIVVAVVDLGGAGDGEAAERVLGELYTGLSTIALRRGGTLERRTGAGAIVTFGLVALHADDAERAVAAALEAKELIASLNRKLPQPLEATWAIHGGMAVVEQNDRAASYAPIGDTVELPTRLAATIAAGKIVVSERIRAALRDHVLLRDMEAVRLKGRSTAVATFEVVAMRTVVEARGALARPPTVGRDALLDAIVRVADESKRGRAIHVVGEPGAGKTRLVEELAARWKTGNQIAIVASARERTLRIEPAVARILETFGGSIDGFRAIGMSASEIRALVRHAEGTSGSAGLGEAEERIAVLAALRSGLERLAARVPVALIVDDLHAAGPITSALVGRGVVEPIPRVTVVTTARPGYQAPWDASRAAAAGLQALVLPPLPDEAIAQLVAGALAPTPPPNELVVAVSARAAGSPLIALEVLRTMVDGGALSSVGGRWTITGDLAAAARPDSLRALLAARIDALPARARDVLACATVFGDELPLELLRHIAANALSGGDPIDREVQLLVARGLLADHDELVRFVESSAREAFYERLSRDARTRLHRAIATALDATPELTVAEEVVADHYLQGGDAAKALDWLARATGSALRSGQRQRAAAALRRARELARDTRQGQARDRRLAEDSLELGELLLELGELASVRAIASEGLAAAHADDDPGLIARLQRLRGRASLATGDVDAALLDLDAALNGALSLRDRVLIAELHADLGEAREKKGELPRAIEYMMNALELAQGTSQHDMRRLALRLLTGLGRVCVRHKELDRAQRFLQQGLELSDVLDDKLGAARVLNNLAGVYHARGDFSTAIRFVRRALDLSREVGDLVGITRQLSNLGTLHVAMGDLPQAASLFDQALQTATRAGWREGIASATAAKDRLRGHP
ncbi:MAG: protein kinase domain-containing protein [Acidobacteriota bacterium]